MTPELIEAIDLLYVDHVKFYKKFNRQDLFEDLVRKDIIKATQHEFSTHHMKFCMTCQKLKQGVDV